MSPGLPDFLDDHIELLHVFDLPQIYSKPSAQDLLKALSLLSLQLTSWNGQSVKTNVVASNNRRKQRVAPEGVTAYLTTIIANGLYWIETDIEREEIWETASARIAERSGRTGMSAISRTFTVPTCSAQIEISVHEPALTSDNLGFKTWAASFLLAQRLHTIEMPRSEPLRVLELGSGTGLVGIACAAILGASVTLTDLPEIEPNLARNVSQNQKCILECGGSAMTAVLDWSDPAAMIFSNGTDSYLSQILKADLEKQRFQVLLAADCIYSQELPRLLVDTIASWLSSGSDARVIVEFPRRERFEAEMIEFRQLMHKLGLVISEEGDEAGFDDWTGASSDELQEIECWWAIWKWA